MPKHEEWEPTAALVATLEGLSLQPEIGRSEHLAELRPHVEEAMAELERLERRRDLSERERIRGEAFRMLLTAIRQGG